MLSGPAGEIMSSNERFLLGEVIALNKITPANTVFHFWNGDKYEGKFLSKKDKQKLVMHGKGMYRTADGHTYDGIWDNDNFKGGIITFPDKSTFTGNLHDMRLEGFGIYRFKDNIEIKGELENNRFIGHVDLIDPNRHEWRAEVKKSDVECVFYPVNPFWQTVLSLPDKLQQFYSEEAEESLFSDS